MPKYQVKIIHITTKTADAVIEADSEEEAEELVTFHAFKPNDIVSDIIQKVEWELDDENFEVESIYEIE